jgi:hypothetical protein
MSFKSEVDAEAAKLIEQGVPPYEALKQAVQIVSNRESSSIYQTDRGDELKQESEKE